MTVLKLQLKNIILVGYFTNTKYHNIQSNHKLGKKKKKEKKRKMTENPRVFIQQKN